MPLQPSRRGFLSLCSVGTLPVALTLSGCARPISECDTDGWSIAAREAGQFFNCHQMSVLSDVADIVVEGAGRSSGRASARPSARPSAQEAQVVEYLDGMIGDWAGPTLKAQLARLPSYLDIHTLSSSGQFYARLARDKRKLALVDFDAAAFEEPELAASMAYSQFKSLLLKVYLTAKVTNRDFARVPGGYFGDLSEGEYRALLAERAEGFVA